MKIRCVWEHNGGDTLLYAVDLPGAYARGDSKEAALEKMRREIPSFLRWAGRPLPEAAEPVIVQEKRVDGIVVIGTMDKDYLLNLEQNAEV